MSCCIVHLRRIWAGVLSNFFAIEQTVGSFIKGLDMTDVPNEE